MKKILILLCISLISFSAFSMSVVERKIQTHVITDHSGAEVEVPVEINRIAVTGIYPLPSVLTVCFF